MIVIGSCYVSAVSIFVIFDVKVRVTVVVASF